MKRVIVIEPANWDNGGGGKKWGRFLGRYSAEQGDTAEYRRKGNVA